MNELYKNLLAKKNNEILKLDRNIKNTLLKCPTELNSYFENFLFKNSKRLRPLYIFLLCDFLNIEIDEDIINFASSIELLHSSSLIHDDILDDGEKRRGIKCIHLEKSVKEAVLAGDYLMFLAFNLISDIKNISLYNLLTKTAYRMINSEISSLNKRNKDITLEDYIKTSKEKTSSLFEACVKGVGIIKNISINDKITSFTENFALCFQIKDDINNFLNKDENKISSDIKCGIKTLPFILNSHGIISEAEDFLNIKLQETKNFLSGMKNKEILLEILNLLN